MSAPPKWIGDQPMFGNVPCFVCSPGNPCRDHVGGPPRDAAPRPTAPVSGVDELYQRRVRGEITRITDKLGDTASGARHDQLINTANYCFKLANGGGIDHGWVRAQLEYACERNGYTQGHPGQTERDINDCENNVGADVQLLDDRPDPHLKRFGSTDVGHLGADSDSADPEPIQYTDFAALLNGALPDPPKPAVLTRTDDICIFYRGKRNELYGDPEGGKTMLAMAAAAQELRDGGNALFIDADGNGPAETAERLLMLGAPRESLTDPSRFRHCQPDDAAELMQYVNDSAGWANLVIIDCVGEVVPMFSGKSNDADDYTRIARQVTTPFITTGAAVILIDHPAKNPDSRAYGSGGTMAKRRAITGVSIELKAKRQFIPGAGGTAELWVNKDRPGGLRRHCPAGTGRRQLAGTFVVESPDPSGRAAWRIAPEGADAAATTFDVQAERYLDAARALARPFTADELAAAVGGETPPTRSQRESARRNIVRLTENGRLEVVKEPTKGHGGAGLWAVSEESREESR